MKSTCTGCDNVTFIQNKKYQLCGECVYKKNHNGKSRQEVQLKKAQEKDQKKHFDIMSNAMKVGTTYRSKIKSGEEVVDQFIKTVNNFGLILDEEALKNIHNQDAAEQKEKEEFSNLEGFIEWSNRYNKEYIGKRLTKENIEKAFQELDSHYGKPNVEFVFPDENGKVESVFDKIERVEKNIKKNKLKRSKPKQVSKKQAEINHNYKLTCIDMDYTTEPVCTGCLKYQGGDIKLSHSHIISREDCKRIGRPDLIYQRENLTYHCMDFGDNVGCHGMWENPTEREYLTDYQKNIEYIKSISEELYLKYTKNE
jgi:3-methyladenine DNA glycosylase AlkD